MKSRRSGFTLVEMLVVLGVLLVLATLTVAVMPRLGEGDKVNNAAVQIQSWLNIAKQWALRDGAPRGLRIVPGADGNTCTEFQFVEQPADYANAPGFKVRLNFTADGGPMSLTVPPAPGGAPSWSLWEGYAPGDPRCPVRAGDFLVVGAGTAEAYVFRLTNDGNGTSFSMSGEVIPSGDASDPASWFFDRSDYRFVRAPRPMAGEKAMYLPKDVVVDLQPTTLQALDAGGVIVGQAPRKFDPTAVGAMLTIGLTGVNLGSWDAPLAAQVGQKVIGGDDDEGGKGGKGGDELSAVVYYGPPIPRLGVNGPAEIVFNPDGSVMNSRGSPDMCMMPLWVRDSRFGWQTNKAICDGEIALVVIHSRTGGVAVHSADRTIQDDGMRYGDPYGFARQGGYSGK